jgi:hypothetical protein
MADIGQVNQVLGGFQEWGRPWEYIQTALGRQGLQGLEIQLIDELWAEATDAKHWLQPSFQSSNESIRKKLAVTHPWLSTEAIGSLIRGASYEWK